MKTFEVLVTRDVTESAVVTVQAENPEKAKASALAIARGGDCPGPLPIWERDDCMGGEPYIADEANAAEEIEPETSCSCQAEGAKE